MYCESPVMWDSKLQTQFTLSTMEADYIALSLFRRDIIPIHKPVKELKTQVFGNKTKHYLLSSFKDIY